MTCSPFAAVGVFCITAGFGLAVWAGEDLWEGRRRSKPWRPPLIIALFSVGFACLAMTGPQA